jgi:two-component system, NtrC family, sensor kinase
LENALNVCLDELKHVSVIRQEYGSVPKISCYPGELNQAFLSLLINAGQAIEPPGEITLKCWCDDEYVHASVGDTGCGIAEEIRSRIFDPFFTTRDIGRGIGLGLSVAYQIVHTHGGTIQVESQTGIGTTFTIVLPITDERDTTSSQGTA